jgi:hypothetical protein
MSVGLGETPISSSPTSAALAFFISLGARVLIFSGERIVKLRFRMIAFLGVDGRRLKWVLVARGVVGVLGGDDG